GVEQFGVELQRAEIEADAGHAPSSLALAPARAFSQVRQAWQGSFRSDTGRRSGLMALGGLPGHGEHRAGKRDKGYTDIADQAKTFVREEQSADPGSDGLADVEHGGIE